MIFRFTEYILSFALMNSFRFYFFICRYCSTFCSLSKVKLVQFLFTLMLNYTFYLFPVHCNDFFRFANFDCFPTHFIQRAYYFSYALKFLFQFAFYATDEWKNEEQKICTTNTVFIFFVSFAIVKRLLPIRFNVNFLSKKNSFISIVRNILKMQTTRLILTWIKFHWLHIESYDYFCFFSSLI